MFIIFRRRRARPAAKWVRAPEKRQYADSEQALAEARVTVLATQHPNWEYVAVELPT